MELPKNKQHKPNMINTTPIDLFIIWFRDLQRYIGLCVCLLTQLELYVVGNDAKIARFNMNHIRLDMTFVCSRVSRRQLILDSLVEKEALASYNITRHPPDICLPQYTDVPSDCCPPVPTTLPHPSTCIIEFCLHVAAGAIPVTQI